MFMIFFFFGKIGNMKNPFLLFIRLASFFNYFFIKDEHRIIHKKRKYEIAIISIGVIVFTLLILWIIPNYIKDLGFLVNLGLSLILLGATFSILSFNYSVALKKNEKELF
jgi:cobalamin biosynthesis protein CobD/CbiB